MQSYCVFVVNSLFNSITSKQINSMKLTIFYLCFFTFLFAFSIQTFAVDFTVNLTSDERDANISDAVCDTDLITAGLQCTLRAAVEQANAVNSNDRVLFNLPANSTVILTAANGGEIPIENNGTLEIIGAGASSLTIDGGAGSNRIFYTNKAVVSISGVTLTGGNATGSVDNGRGGAIYAFEGALTLNGVHVRGNAAPSNAGGGLFLSRGTSRIINSTISTNSALGAAGFVNAEGMLTVTNSTISGNSTPTGGGGGFSNTGTVTLSNVTITKNTAAQGGGIFQTAASGAINFNNTIVAGNLSINNSNPEIRFAGGTITSTGGNLVGNSSGDSIDTRNPITYHPTDLQDINPLLGPLANNGGTTPTHSLSTGSPAIDKGINALVPDAFDQRGTDFPRVRDGNGDGTATVDIGAFEVQMPPASTSVSVSGRVTSANGRGINKVRVTIIDSSGETRTAYSNPFGYYRFISIPAGTTYTFNLSHKYHQFNQNTQVLIVAERNDINFVANN